jgi:hypothetical protein
MITAEQCDYAADILLFEHWHVIDQSMANREFEWAAYQALTDTYVDHKTYRSAQDDVYRRNVHLILDALDIKYETTE